MATETYQVRISGRVGRAGQDAFSDLIVHTEPALTVLTGDFDRQGLHELLDRVRALGLELIDIQQLQREPSEPE